MIMLEQLNEALDAVKIEPKDRPTAALARYYAELLDNAAPAAKYTKALRWLAAGASQDDEKSGDYADLIMTALSEHTTASDLGPKLLAALTALGMTPAAAGIAIPKPGAAPQSPLDELRQRKADKQARQGTA
jgi:hypothetical protein